MSSAAAVFTSNFLAPIAMFSICSEDKVEKILQGGLDSIPSPSPSVKIQMTGGKVCLRCKGKLSLKLNVMGSNPGYLLKSFLLYQECQKIPSEILNKIPSDSL